MQHNASCQTCQHQHARSPRKALFRTILGSTGLFLPVTVYWHKIKRYTGPSACRIFPTATQHSSSPCMVGGMGGDAGKGDCISVGGGKGGTVVVRESIGLTTEKGGGRINVCWPLTHPNHSWWNQGKVVTPSTPRMSTSADEAKIPKKTVVHNRVECVRTKK